MFFTDLPPELIIHILAASAFRDILVCRRVCRWLRDIIEESLQLQYIVELGCGGYVDGPDDRLTNMSLEERYRKLVGLEEGWKTLSFPISQIKYFNGPSSIYELYGGVYVRGLLGEAAGGVTFLQVTQFPSALAQCPGRAWDHVLETPCRDISIDPGSDLMVVTNKKEGSTWEVSLRTLSGNRPHPDASNPSLLFATNDHDSWTTFTISILEDQLAVMFSPYEGSTLVNRVKEGELVVWNWKTGMLRTVLRGPFVHPTSFTFISPNVFMIGEVESRQTSFENPNDRHRHLRASLVVYAIPPQDDKDAIQVEARKVAIFHFPLFKSNVHEVRLSSRSDPSPVQQRWPSASTVSSGHYKAFCVDPLKRVIVLSLDLSLRRRGLLGLEHVEKEYTIFVHSNMFTSLLGEQRVLSGEGFTGTMKEFNWRQWQMFARWTTLQRSPGHYVCYVYGQRYIDYEQDPFANRMHLWDFNTSVRRPHRIFPQSTALPKSSSIYDGSKLEEQAAYIDPKRDILSRKRAGVVGAGVSPMNPFAFVPVIETGTSVIKDKDIFVYKKVKSSLPFRRTTGRAKLPHLAGIMLDDERVYMFERLQDGSGVRMGVLAMEAVDDSDWGGVELD